MSDVYIYISANISYTYNMTTETTEQERYFVLFVLCIDVMSSFLFLLLLVCAPMWKILCEDHKTYTILSIEMATCFEARDNK